MHELNEQSPSGEFLSVHDLTVVVVADTPHFASVVIDSLPAKLPYFLVGPRNIAFLRRSKWCRQYFVNDLAIEEDNKADFVRTIERLSSTNSNIFLIPADDPANRIVHATFDRLAARSYPMPDSSLFEMLNDKWQFFQYCRKLGVRVPNTIRLNDKAEIDFDYVCAMVGLPFVLKPTNKNNSLGVHVISSKEQFRNAILSSRECNLLPLIAQTFIPGVDIDISIFANGGDMKNFAVQTRKEDVLWFVQNDQLVKFTDVLIRNLCYTGVMHIDARLHNATKEVFLVEANPRFWGSLGEATWCGLNFVRAGIHTSLGSESSDPTTLINVSVPSMRRIVVEIATGRRSYLQLSQQQRLLVRHSLRAKIRKLAHLPWWL
jgi:predicted ATP-grasp superfamily ATP-dependent carboligase